MIKVDMRQEKEEFTLRFLAALDQNGHREKTLGELKAIFGLSRTLLFKFKNSKGLPSIFSGKLLSEKLNVPFDWFMTGAGDISGFQISSADELAILERYRGLTINGKKKLMAFAFIECGQHELTPSNKTARLSNKQASLKLITKK